MKPVFDSWPCLESNPDEPTIMMVGKVEVTLPRTRIVNSNSTYESGKARYSLEKIREMSTEDIVKSLAPGVGEPLAVKSDGRIFDGNTIIKVLQERWCNV